MPISLRTDDLIDVTEADPVALVQAAYDLSAPIGLGLAHYLPGALSAEDAQAILTPEPDEAGFRRRGDVVVSMDYVRGRCCKFTIFRDDEGRRWIAKHWRDHSRDDLQELLRRCNLDPEKAT